MLFSCEPERKVTSSDEKAAWTVMFYIGSDNDLERNLLSDLAEIKAGFRGGMNMIVLVDRSSGYYTSEEPFGENFSGIRVYKLSNGKYVRLTDFSFIPENTAEQNSADGKLLSDYISYCKDKFPAEYYALHMGSHGEGVRSGAFSDRNESIIYSQRNNDWIYTAEFTDKLTKEDSVDIFLLDACYMGNIEFIYQIRKGNGGFSADYVVASSHEIWGRGWDYESIFKRIKTGSSIETSDKSQLTGRNKVIFGQSEMSPLNFGELVMEEIYDTVIVKASYYHAISFYETEKALDVKNAFDELSVLLSDYKEDITSIRGSGMLNQSDIVHYFRADNEKLAESMWFNFPFFDLYDFCRKIYERNLNDYITSASLEVMNAVDSLIILSMADSAYGDNFTVNKNGVSFFFPDGDRIYEKSKSWKGQSWYNSIDLSEAGSKSKYGKLLWCIDNAVPGNDKVENWFELLDSWFDDSNDDDGGLNYYKW